MTAPRAQSPRKSEDEQAIARPSISTVSRSRTSSPSSIQENGPAPQSALSYETLGLQKPPGATRDADDERAARGPPLEFRWLPLVLAIVYLITLIVPWVLMCFLNNRPFTTPSYHDQRGRMDARGIERALTFINVFRSISGVIVIPITSLILSHAVVAYSQRHSHEKKLNMRQLFALADRGWVDVKILWGAVKGPSSSRLLWLGAGLIVLGGIQQPLQSVLISMAPIAATTSNDLPSQSFREGAIIVGYDAEPWAISVISQKLVVEDVASALITISEDSDQENLWLDTPFVSDEDVEDRAYDDPIGQTTLGWYRADWLKEHRMRNPGSSFFVTSLANGTTTGVLREHALRLNSSISCERISREEYPSTCPGPRPLSTDIETDRVTLRACAPGDMGVSPWTESRNRQDIDEELYLDFSFVKMDPGFTIDVENYTMHCTSSTSRGYFELGNVMNDNRYGPLMDRWPDPEYIETETNNWLPWMADEKRPTELDEGRKDPDGIEERLFLDPFNLQDTPTPGPLMVSANALFGNYSFLNIVRDSPGLSALQTHAVLCEYGRRVPFTQILGMAGAPNDKHVIYCQGNADGRDPRNEDVAVRHVDEVVASWASIFTDVADAEFLFLVSTFVANKALLEKSIAGPIDRPMIFSSPGTRLTKPSLHVVSMVVVSALILLQAVGLGAMVWYIWRRPTWTAGLNAMALTRIGKAMDDDKLPPIGPVSEDDRAKLEQVDALVGISEGTNTYTPPVGEHLTVRGQLGIPLVELDRRAEDDLKFGLGAKGLIATAGTVKSQAYRPVRRRPRMFGSI